MSESTTTANGPGWRRESWLILRDAFVLTGITCVVALVVNIFHPEAIPYFATKEYEILVPCPEEAGAALAMAVDAPELTAETTFVVDARSAEEFAVFHFGVAINVTYDYLDATPPETLKALAKRIVASRAQRVVVYGDGDDPDTGEELAREISGRGIKNVYFVQGGAPALEALAGKGGAP